jgi:hypothetical protein
MSTKESSIRTRVTVDKKKKAGKHEHDCQQAIGKPNVTNEDVVVVVFEYQLIFWWSSKNITVQKVNQFVTSQRKSEVVPNGVSDKRFEGIQNWYYLSFTRTGFGVCVT